MFFEKVIFYLHSLFALEPFNNGSLSDILYPLCLFSFYPFNFSFSIFVLRSFKKFDNHIVYELKSNLEYSKSSANIHYNMEVFQVSFFHKTIYEIQFFKKELFDVN